MEKQEKVFQDSFDVIEMGGSDVHRYIVIAYKGDMHTVPQEKIWHLLGGDYNKSLDRWFNEAKYVDKIFGEGHGFYMSSVIGMLTIFLNDIEARLPVKGFDVNLIKK